MLADLYFAVTGRCLNRIQLKLAEILIRNKESKLVLTTVSRGLISETSGRVITEQITSPQNFLPSSLVRNHEIYNFVNSYYDTFTTI